jgi:hypothetical protein
MHGRRARGYVLSDTAVFRMRGPRVRGAARRGGMVTPHACGCTYYPMVLNLVYTYVYLGTNGIY